MRWFITVFFMAQLAFSSEALNYARKSCRNQKNPNPRACWLYARLLYYNGQVKESNRYYKKACGLGEKLACDHIKKGLPRPQVKLRPKPRPKPITKSPIKRIKSKPKVQSEVEKAKEEVEKAQVKEEFLVPPDISPLIEDIYDIPPEFARKEETKGPLEKTIDEIEQERLEKISKMPNCFKGIMKRLLRCRKYSCRGKDTLDPKIMVSHTISKKGKYCYYTQTIESQSQMKCKLHRRDLFSMPPNAKREEVDIIMGQWLDFGLCQKLNL
jgi:hypothetical protein